MLIKANTGDLVLQGCRVVDGQWLGLYSGERFTHANSLVVYHTVPLKEAHDSGAEFWAREQRKVFANDPENLLAVKASQNRSKGSRDPAQWMPSLKSYHCEYAARWLLVKAKYNLIIDTAERLKLITLIIAC